MSYLHENGNLCTDYGHRSVSRMMVRRPIRSGLKGDAFAGLGAEVYKVHQIYWHLLLGAARKLLYQNPAHQ